MKITKLRDLVLECMQMDRENATLEDLDEIEDKFKLYFKQFLNVSEELGILPELQSTLV